MLPFVGVAAMETGHRQLLFKPAGVDLEATDAMLLGLTAADMLIYQHLVDREEAPIEEVRRLLPASQRPEAAGAIRRLVARGLIKRQPGRPAAYAAIDPQVTLAGIIQEQETRAAGLRGLAKALSDRYRDARLGTPPTDMVQVVEGPRDVHHEYGSLLRSAREQIRAMERPPFQRAPDENRAITAEVHEHGVRVRNLMDAEALKAWDMRLIEEDLAHGEQFRVIARVPIKLLVVDDRAALVPLEQPTNGIQSALLVHSSALLEALIDVFETLWAIATPLDTRNESVHPGTTDFISSEERILVTLLASGIPDDAIARRLQISASSLYRRVHVLKARLAAASRFQAGVNAALRGWVSNAGV